MTAFREDTESGCRWSVGVAKSRDGAQHIIFYTTNNIDERLGHQMLALIYVKVKSINNH